MEKKFRTRNPSFIFLLVLLFSTTALARWANSDDAAYRVNFEKLHVKIKKDGSSVTTIERQIEILKSQARETNGLQRLTYNSTNSRFKVVEAKTINNGKQMKVPKQDIEIKPLASSGPGFDIITQVTIAFPDVEVGSKLYTKTEEVETRAKLPGMYFVHYPLWGEDLQNLDYTYESEIPIYPHVHDPEQVLEVKAEPKSVRISLKREYMKQVVDEAQQRYDGSKYAWIAMSSLKTWADFPKSTLEAYERDLSSALPKKFEEIRRTANEEKTEIQKMNAVTSLLANTIRYVGDWRALEGLWHPRRLSKIASSGYGDCKDFAVSLGAILRTMGYETHIAWVGRGANWTSSPLDEKVLLVNHAILLAKKNGQEYWLDPTNIQSFAQGVFPDIANRTAVVLGKDSIAIKKTPSLGAQDSRVRLTGEFSVDKSGVLKGSRQIDFLDRAALGWTGLQLSYSKENMNFMLLDTLGLQQTVQAYNFEPYDLSSRKTADFSIRLDYSEYWRPLLTSAGKGLSIPANYQTRLFNVRREDRAADLLLTEPTTFTREFRVNEPRIRTDLKLNCSGDSKWASFKRTLGREGNLILFKETSQVKTGYIPTEEVASPEFEKFQHEILGCMGDLILVFKE